ncbi:uncharacterized protein LOC114755603 [Neltuma alba]|uniref:uncharacterized protein LOC114755603 n=1 Tax=Neltuma alba TaxID=207710 RepID=UPI0010A5580B|nr:uncharacterized protein LOC114755603 [Prosopis alba]
MRASSEAFLVRDWKEEDQWAARLRASTRRAKTKTERPSANWESMGIAPAMVKSKSYFGQRSMGEGEFYVLEENELFLQNRSMSHGSMILKLKLISQCLLDVSLLCGILLPWPCEFNTLINTIFSLPATVALIVVVFLDKTLKVEKSKKDRGMTW